MDTLVLSSAYQPMRYVDWREAFSLWLSGRAEVVEFYTDRTIKTVSEIFNVPSIIRFVGSVIKKARQSKPAKYNRTNVFLRDNGQCQYCSKSLTLSTFTLDHVVPASRGGKASWKNIVCACKNCNQLKKDMLPKEAGMKLNREPYIPGSFEILSKGRKNLPEGWDDYLRGFL